MQINLFSSFRDVAGFKTIDLQMPPNSNVWDVIDRMLLAYPALKNIWINKQGELYGHVQVSINKIDANSLPEGMNTHLQPDDILDFFPPIVGG